ncbi:glycoside hydrolase family 5 protein [Temperatibacter marinus]|uniref:Glycoside hydrolase family 5 protein n=1 Tax=Temperatibacter marinus TaxID=1456591 RepID=A0AA52HAK9_9PROT|nr:glycoside hydrolase family 5 protein [Temperatibacter marinus]WND02708.1 glycoside hydrolase family 5 protein [Temperatibacter marinus]
MKQLVLILSVCLFSFLSQANDQVILGKGTNLAHYISQTSRTGEDRRNFLSEKDIAYIASLGFDHVRLPIDEKQMWFEDGQKDAVAFQLMHNVIKWSLHHDLKVVIDLHILRSHHFNAKKKPLWTDLNEQEKFINLWRDLSEELKSYPTDKLVYELMNEPVADDPEDWNKLVQKVFSEIRSLEADRWIVIGSNRWQSADTFDELKIPNDRKIILSYHFYEPFLLSHYKTPWTFLKPYDGPVNYPGPILKKKDFNALPSEQQGIVKDYVGKKFDKKTLLKMMEKPLAKAKKLGLPLYCGEYGVFFTVSEKDRLAWYKDMMEIFREHHISSANWNYKSKAFGFVDDQGKPIPAMRDVLLEK